MANFTEREGIFHCGKIAAKNHWMFREQPVDDVGIDAHMEFVELEFIHALSENMNNLESTEATIKYNHAFNNLAIIASPEVLLSLYELANLMINHIKNNNVSDYENKYTKLFTILVKEMRSDLYGKKSGKVNKGLNEIYLISGVLKVRPEEDEK